MSRALALAFWVTAASLRVGVALQKVPTSADLEQSRNKKPHILTLLIDDLGFYDTSFQGNENMRTPHIDALAKSGRILNRHYAYFWCAPTRASFLSGRLPMNLPGGEENPYQDLRTQTVGQKLQEAGYVTHLFGKWHVGYETMDHLPINRGFDSHVGYIGSASVHYSSGDTCGDAGVGYVGGGCGDAGKPSKWKYGLKDLWHDKQPAEKELLGQYSTTLYSNLAVRAIKNHSQNAAGKPMWIHLTYTAMHGPYEAPFDAHGNRKKEPYDEYKVFQEMLTQLDNGIKKVIDALHQENMWGNTLVIFMSDNGGTGQGNNYPLRGKKMTPWEGGVRVASFISGGFLPSAVHGKDVDGFIHICDWYPTLVKLAGGNPHDNPHAAHGSKDWFPPLDGFDMWPMLTGSGKRGASPRTLIPHGELAGALTSGQHKILVNAAKTGWDTQDLPQAIEANDTCVGDSIQGFSSGHVGDGARKSCRVCSMEKPCVYDIIKDPGETTNLFPSNMKLVKSLKALYSKHILRRKKFPDPTWECNEFLSWNGFTGPKCAGTQNMSQYPQPTR